MSEDQTARSDPRLTFAATVPLRVPPRFTPMELLMTVCDMLDGTGVVATIDPDLSDLHEEVESASRFWNRPQVPPRAGLTVNGITMLVVGHDRPAFSPAELSRLDYADWLGGAEKIARGRAHVEITEVETGTTKDLDYNYDRAAAMTVAAAAVDRLTGALGMVWHTSRRAVPSDRIGRIFEELIEGAAPVSLWVSCPPLPNGAHGVATRGFYPLLGAEIAVISTRMSAREAGVTAIELVTDILRSGEAPAHGERLHYARGIQFRVEHRAVGVDGGVPVVVLAQVGTATESPGKSGGAPGAAAANGSEPPGKGAAGSGSAAGGGKAASHAPGEPEGAASTGDGDGPQAEGESSGKSGEGPSSAAAAGAA